MKITIDQALENVKCEIKNTLSKSPLIIRKYTRHLSESFGKMIRANALLICAQDDDGLINPDAVRAAAAIELLHLATLVHDDIIDDADIRRGQATLQRKYGKRTAVICGDYLFCMALKLVSSFSERDEYLKIDFPDYMGRVCLGELNQHINNHFYSLSVYNYLKIISGKTAALFEAAFFAGAVLSEKGNASISQYKKLGRYIGMIFQITDDCLDFEVAESTVKKPVQSDYEQGVITLPLIYAFSNMADLKEKAEKKELTRSELNGAVLETGGLQYARLISRKYYDKSNAIINNLDTTENKKNKLRLILEKASRVG
jgi:heptaprenyl diphosphate synthase